MNGASDNSEYLTVDLGGTKSAVAVGNCTGNITDRRQCRTEPPPTTVPWLIEHGRELLAAHPNIAAVGISCGSPLNSRTGVVQGPPNMPNWDDVPICRMFEEAFGLPCYLENDANAGALAEWRFGAARGYHNVIFVTCGTGFGAGLILDGRLYRGDQDGAGEIGHVRLESDGPIGYHKAGSVEGFASGGALTQRARMHLQQPHPPTALDRLPPDQVTAKHVGQAAVEGDSVAIELVHQTGRYVGRALAILIDLLNPQCIVLGAMAVRLGDMLIQPAWEVIRAECLDRAWKNCKIVPAQLGEQIGDVAALCVALYNHQK